MNAIPHRPKEFLDEAKSLACIHCGLCLSSCPTYLETGNENDSPRGRIYLMRAFQDGSLPLSAKAVKHIDLCLGCRACEVACPSGVEYGTLLENSRDYIEKNFQRGFWQTWLRRFVIEQIFPFPRRFQGLLWPARWIRGLKLDRLLPAQLRGSLELVPLEWGGRPLPAVAPPARAPAKGRVGFIQGCVMSVLFRKTNLASVELLNAEGYEVVTPGAQVCCGALYAHGGNLAKARACARRNIAAFENLDLDAIIINAAGCGSTLKAYHHLLERDPAWAGRALAFTQKVQDLTEFLLPLRRSQAARPAPANPSLTTYHDACHLAHAQRITAAPRELVQAVAGAAYRELPEAEVCCGSAGSYNLTEPAMAERLQERKIANILRTGAAIVVTTNPGCILQIEAGLKKAGQGQIKVLHIADYLAQRGG